MRRGKPWQAAWMVAASAGARSRIWQSAAGFVSRFFRSVFQFWGGGSWVGIWGCMSLPRRGRGWWDFNLISECGGLLCLRLAV